MKRWILALLIGECLLAGPVYCQANKSPPEDPAHDQLRAVRKGLEEAFNKRDIDRLVQFLHPNVVVIWQNGEVNRGRDQVRAYYQRMLLDKNGIVESLMVDLDVAELSILYGK